MGSKTEVKGPYRDDDGMWCVDTTTTSVTTLIYRFDDKERAEQFATMERDGSHFGKENA